MADRTVKVTLTAGVNTFISDWERAQRAVEKSTKATEDATAKYERQAQAMREVGGAVTAVGAVAVAATALAVKAAIDWETAWAGVTKTVDGSATEMAALEEGLRSLARELPASHQEIAAVAEAAGQLGVAREDITSFTRVMIDLAETTNLTADEAATSIAQLMNVMGSAPEDVDNLGAALVALGNDGASTERDIIQMAQRIAGAGRIVGLTEAQVLGFANALASVGIEAEAGGSAISRIMTDIAKSVSTGGEKLNQFAEVAGMSSQQFQKAFRDDPANAIATFIEGLARIDRAGGDVFTTLEELGQSDIRVSQALLGMANSGDLLRESLQLGAEAWDENTALTEEAAKRYETTAAQLQILGNKANDVAISMGSAFLPAVSAVTEAIGGLLDGFSALPEGIQQQISILGGLAAAATLAGGAFLLAVPKIAEFRIALGTLAQSSIPAVAAAAGRTQKIVGGLASFFAGPWGVALAAAGIGLIELQRIMGSFEASAEELRNSLQTAADGAEVLSTAAPGGYNLFFKDALSQFEDLDDFLNRLDKFNNDFLARGPLNIGNNAALQAPSDALARIGEELQAIATQDAPAAAEAFQKVAAETDGSEVQLLRLLDTMPAYKTALTEQATAQGLASDAQTLLKLAMEETERPTEVVTQKVDDLAEAADQAESDLSSMRDALDGIGDTALTMGEALDNAQSALEDMAEAAQAEGASLEGADDASRAFRDTIREVETSHKDAAAAILENGGTLDEATGKYYQGRDAVIEMLKAKGLDAEEAAAWADANLGSAEGVVGALGNVARAVQNVPDRKVIQLVADTVAAMATINRFVFDNDGRRINFYVDGYVGRKVAGSNLIDVARAEGGYIPGTPSRRDNMLAAVASGEFVTRTSEAQKPANRPWLEYMNAGGQMPPFRGYAGGGFVQPQYMSSSPVVNVAAPSLEGAVITGQVELVGDGILRIVDGRITQYDRDQRTRAQMGSRR